jgi:hypothetical protein
MPAFQSVIQSEFPVFGTYQGSQQTMTGESTYTEQFVCIACQTIPALVHVLRAGACTDDSHGLL